MLESVVAPAVAVVGLELGVVVVVGLELERGGVPPHQLHHLVVRNRLVGLDDLWIFYLSN